MNFNADAYHANGEPPSITLGGRTYIGRHLSFEQWIPLQHMLLVVQTSLKNQTLSEDPMTAAQQGWLAQAKMSRAVKKLIDAMFPRTSWFQPRVSKLLQQQPMDVQLEALNSFMESQATYLGSLTRKRRATTPATTSTS